MRLAARQPGWPCALALLLALLLAGATRPLAADELTTVRWPGNQARTVLYDAAGRATQVTDERGIVRQPGYDTGANGVPTLQVRRLTWDRDGWPVAGAPAGE